MSQDVERVYTVNLGKVLLSPDNQRAKRAVNMVKEFARHHMKIEQVKLEEDVSHLLWARGIRHPPRKIRVRMTKTDEGYVLVSIYEGEEESIKEEEKKVESEPAAKPEPKLNQNQKLNPRTKPKAKSEPEQKLNQNLNQKLNQNQKLNLNLNQLNPEPKKLNQNLNRKLNQQLN